MSTKVKAKSEKQLQDALSVVELEARHEMTVVAEDMDRCNGNRIGKR